MTQHKRELIFGSLLVLVGVFALAVNLEVIYLQSEYMVSVGFLAAAVLLFVRFQQSGHFLALVAASIMAFIASAIFISHSRLIDDEMIAVILFWGMGGLFVYGFLREQAKWGLLIPAGVVFTLGLMVLIDASRALDDDLMPGMFFLGNGLTFAILYLIRNETNKLEWAKIPAFILIVFSGFIFLSTSDSVFATLVFPLSLMAIGAYLVYRSLQNGPTQNKLESA